MLLLSAGVHVVCSNMVSHYMSFTCVTKLFARTALQMCWNWCYLRSLINRIQEDTLHPTTYDIKHVRLLLHGQLQFMEHY